MDPPSSDSNDSNEAPTEYRVYKKRYFLLATLFMLNLSNAMVSLLFYCYIVGNG